MFDRACFLEKLDRLYAGGQGREAEELLMTGLSEASHQGDKDSMLLILNEMIGYYRVFSRREECRRCSELALQLAEQLDLKGTVSYATTLLNAATGNRQAGDRELALSQYLEAAAIYGRELPEDDYRQAAVANNIAILYSETGEYSKALKFYKQALSVIVRQGETRPEEATTRANLALVFLRLGRQREAEEEIQKSLSLFESQGTGPDPHYGAALSALGEACARTGRWEASLSAYGKALRELERFYGKNQAYRSVEASMQAVKILSENQGVRRDVWKS